MINIYYRIHCINIENFYVNFINVVVFLKKKTRINLDLYTYRTCEKNHFDFSFLIKFMLLKFQIE